MSKCTDDDLQDTWQQEENVDWTGDALSGSEDESEPEESKKRPAPVTQAKEPSKKAKAAKLLHKYSALDCSQAFNDVYRPYLFVNGVKDAASQSVTKECHFLCPTEFGKHTLTSLTRFVRFLVPEWKKQFKTKHANETYSPLVIIMSSSATRSVELLKYLVDFQCHIAKLFARHMKVEEQITMLQRYHPIAVGTPNRIKKLIDVQGLDISNTKHIVLDMQRDAKNFTILELKDTQKDIMNMFHQNLKQKILKGDMHFSMY